MTERPILFSAPMIRAILAGQKTQTRRALRRQFGPDAAPVEMPKTTPEGWVVGGHSGVWWCDAAANPDDAIRCPYGVPGDRLWVRETWSQNEDQLSETRMDTSYVYRADGERRALDNGVEKPWRPSIHMPRRASRITLEITGVRVERLQDISDDDARQEGVAEWARGALSPQGQREICRQEGFEMLWKQINGAESWDANPYVWVVEFKRA
jgi:hypothetical protein